MPVLANFQNISDRRQHIIFIMKPKYACTDIFHGSPHRKILGSNTTFIDDEPVKRLSYPIIQLQKLKEIINGSNRFCSWRYKNNFKGLIMIENFQEVRKNKSAE